jgi:hypothetical protein
MTALVDIDARRRSRTDLTGAVFCRLTVIVRRAGSKTVRAIWLCRCQCGTERWMQTADLTSGRRKSCGCWVGEKMAEGRAAKHRAQTTHGLSATPEYETWKLMLRRCEQPRERSFADYGGRGIRVCARWHSFEFFRNDMGPRPSDMTIDRRDVDGHYSCGHCDECRANGWSANCRWATLTEQARNTRVTRLLTFRGETRCLAEWADVVGISSPTLHRRLSSGWSVDRALSEQPRSRRRAT